MFYSFQSTYLDHFGRFRIQYLIVFNIVINWINSFVCLPAASLLVYTNTTVFCKLISYYVGMMDSFIISCNFWWNLSGFSTHSIMSSQKTESLILSLLIWMTFIYFCCLIAEASTSSTTLKKKKTVKMDIPVMFLTFGENLLVFFSLGKIFTLSISYVTFMILRYFPSIPIQGGIFSRKDVVFCQADSLHLLRGSYASCSFLY